MPSQLPLDMLINLAKESTDEAARRLGRLSTERTNAERQLGMLQDYRQDYLERLQQAMKMCIRDRDRPARCGAVRGRHRPTAGDRRNSCSRG